MMRYLGGNLIDDGVNRSASKHRLTGGFTLVEVLTVIGIIALLAGLIGPAITQARRLAKHGAAMAQLHTIEAGLGMYKSDFNGYYPPSSDTATAHSGWYGCELLAYFMTGYPTDDGEDGWGFRVQTPGKLYGPYAGTEGLRLMDGATAGRKVFADNYGNVFRYWRYNSTSSTYTQGDESDGPTLNSTYAKDSADRWRRTDYILASPGEDGTWDSSSMEDKNDITNLKGE